MFGERHIDAQLALMDSIVFFLAAMVVSAVLFSTVRQDADRELSGVSWFDAESALDAILRCSLGTDTNVVAGGEPVTIPSRTEIGECLLLEAHFIAEGDVRTDFVDLELEVSQVLKAVCPPCSEIQLVVSELRNGTPEKLFYIPWDWTETGLVSAATAELAGTDGGTFLVQLRSAPAAAPEPP